MPTIWGTVSPKRKRRRPLHERLHALLFDAYKRGEFTQESLGAAIGQSQENAGAYLKGRKAGALDVDEAEDALRHIGSSLVEFLTKAPPREMTAGEKLARALDVRPDLAPVVTALLDVSPQRLLQIRDGIDALVRIARDPRKARRGGSRGGNTPEGHPK